MNLEPFADDELPRRAQMLADFHSEFAHRLLADLEESGVLAGVRPETVAREWDSVSLHACVRGIVAGSADPSRTPDLVDAFHDLVLAEGVAEGAYEPQPMRRVRLAERYAEYDGVVRTLGQAGADRVPAAIATACVAHLAARDARAAAEALAPLLEALAEGAHMAASAPPRPGPQLPPFEGLLSLTARLDAAGVPWAVGGSALLAALGIADEAHDWDVQVEAGPTQLQELFADRPHAFSGNQGCHADWKLAFETERTELIARFAFAVEGGVVRIPLAVSRRWRGLPMASPEAWACAYWVLARHGEEAQRGRRRRQEEAIFGWLERHGADRILIEIVRAERLPDDLDARLALLPRR